MANNVSESEMNEYKSLHVNCCGFGKKTLSYRQRRKQGKSNGSIGGASYHS